jgi:hypothetical protein
MSYERRPQHREPMAPEEMLATSAALAAIAISPFALLAAIPLVFLKRRHLRGQVVSFDDCRSGQ